MALTADRAELAQGFRRRRGRWPTGRELDGELRFTVRAAMNAELAGRRADPVLYEKAVDRIARRLEKAARAGAPAGLPLADEYQRLADTVSDQAAADGFARLAKQARAAS